MLIFLKIYSNIRADRKRELNSILEFNNKCFREAKLSVGQFCFSFFVQILKIERNNSMSTKEVSHKVIEHIGTISTKNNYSKEVNIISWNGRPPVYDIRIFKTDVDGLKYPLKGLSFNKEDLITLKEVLASIDFGV